MGLIRFMIGLGIIIFALFNGIPLDSVALVPLGLFLMLGDDTKKFF